MGIISAWTKVQAPLISTAKIYKKAVNAKHPPLFLHYLNKLLTQSHCIKYKHRVTEPQSFNLSVSSNNLKYILRVSVPLCFINDNRATEFLSLCIFLKLKIYPLCLCASVFIQNTYLLVSSPLRFGRLYER